MMNEVVLVELLFSVHMPYLFPHHLSDPLLPSYPHVSASSQLDNVPIYSSLPQFTSNPSQNRKQPNPFSPAKQYSEDVIFSMSY